MKINELKNIIRECVKEVILEESGLISHIIAEAMVAVVKSQQLLNEQHRPSPSKDEPMFKNGNRNPSLSVDEKKKINETKKKLLESVGKDAYNGVDVFAGTKPLSSGGDPASNSSVQSPLSIYAPDDAGVPVEKIFESAGLWGKIAAGVNKKKK